MGAHLTAPWRVVLAGRPNVGKSSLTNALVGYQRAIVHELPGTTRDAVTASTAVEGWPIELVDTAGLRPAGDPLEAAGMELARRQVQSADLVLAVFDRSGAWSAADTALLDEWPDALAVFNKSDLSAGPQQPDHPGMLVSAQSGEGLDSLITAIAARLVPASPPPGQAVPFLPWHVATLAEVRAALASGDGTRAGELVARFAPGR